MRKNTLILYIALLGTIVLTGCAGSSVPGSSFFSSKASVPHEDNPSSAVQNPEFWQRNPDAIWTEVQQIPLDKLEADQSNPAPNAAGWFKLAIISKRYSTDTAVLVPELTAWRAQYPEHPGNKLFPSDAALSSLAATPAPKSIALLLPLQGKYAPLGNAVRNGFVGAYYQSLAKTSYQQTISFYDTSSGQSLSSLYQQAVAKGADMVVGPLTKEEVTQLIGSSSFSVPTIALNYTDVGWGSLPSNLYEFGLSPIDEAKQVADKAWETGHTRAIIIAPQNEWGQRAAKALTDRWENVGGKVADTYYFSPKSNLTKEIAQLLHIDQKADTDKSRDQLDRASLEQQRRHDFDVIFLLAPPQSARQIVPLLRFYYVDKTAIFSTSIVYAGMPQPQKDTDLNGVTFLDSPWILGGRGTGLPEANRLFAVGQDSYLISRNLQRFTVLPNFPMYASTGSLTLTSQKQFYRRLAWAQIHNGRP